MLSWFRWKTALAERLSTQLGVTISADEIVVPPDRTFGDFAFACFRLAKERGISPVQLAKEAADAFDEVGLDVASVSAQGPYVNFTLATDLSVASVVREVESAGTAYGHWPQQSGAPTLFEYANPNTHKDIHVGHLRMLLLGLSVVRIAKAAGQQIIPISFVNDLGNNVAKCLWQLVNDAGCDPATLTNVQEAKKILASIASDKHNGKFLAEVYVAATNALEANETLKEKVSFVQHQLEVHAPAWEYLWRETRQWCLDELFAIFREIGIELDHQYLESEVIDRSIEIVDELVQKNVATTSQGALIVDLEDKKLGAALIRKTDGTHLYLTKDLALAEVKFEDYPTIARSVVMTDDRQALHFRQLAEILKRMGVTKPYEFFGYGLVVLKDGAMSSRKGNIVTYQAVREAMIAYARGEIVARHADWSETKIAHTSWSIAMAGMKFAVLKQDPNALLTFDLQQSLSFDGATGPYCQYAATRMASILRKAGCDEVTLSSWKHEELSNCFDHRSEKNLCFVMAELPMRIEQAARESRPSVIAQWCVDLSQAINDWYRDVKILDAPEDMRSGKLRLAAAARQSLAVGLELLAIEVPEEM